MGTIIALTTFHAGLLAIILIPMSITVEGRGERARARQLRSLALALGLVVALAQSSQWGVPLAGRIALATIGTMALVLPLRRVRAECR